MNTENKSGSNTDTCTTSGVASINDDLSILVQTHFLLLLKYGITSLTALVVNPNHSKSLVQSSWWLTLSKALEESSKTNTETSPLSVGIRRSFVFFSKYIVVQWFTR
jgi:hypothetical protein